MRVEIFKEFIGYYRFLVKQESQLKNYKESLVAKGRNSTLIKKIDKLISALKKEQMQLVKTMQETIRDDSKLFKKLEAIVSIKGVGDITALVFLYLFIRYPEVNQKQIVSFAGLDPIMHESETSIKAKMRISKAGDKIYRGTLFMPAMVAIRYNARLKAYYDRLKNSGKHTTVAQVTVMRKILIIAHSIYKSEEMYKM